MGRLIDASMLKEKILAAEIKRKGALSGTEVYNVIDNTPTCTAAWIPVSERLPEDGEYDSYTDGGMKYLKRLEVAYMTDTIEYMIGYYNGYAWIDKRYNNIVNVVAWKRHEPYRPQI